MRWSGWVWECEDLGLGRLGGERRRVLLLRVSPWASEPSVNRSYKVGPSSSFCNRPHTDNPTPDESQTFARTKFGTQKGISSDEFFGRNAFDPSAAAESRTRLQGFEGATSISSNAYFGRPEDEVDLGGDGNLEDAAKDFVRRFGITAGDDIENLTAMLGDGATKLRGAVREYLNS